MATAAAFASRQLWLMARQRWHRFGYACVNFGSPVSARDYLASRRLDLAGLGKEERFARIEELARHLMSAIARVTPVLPVALVSTVLEQRRSRAISTLELKTEVHSLMQRLEATGAQVYVPRRDREYAIEVGVRMLLLRRAVTRRADGLLSARPEEASLLRFYANSIAHLVVEAQGSGALGAGLQSSRPCRRIQSSLSLER